MTPSRRTFRVKNPFAQGQKARAAASARATPRAQHVSSSHALVLLTTLALRRGVCAGAGVSGAQAPPLWVRGINAAAGRCAQPAGAVRSPHAAHARHALRCTERGTGLPARGRRSTERGARVVCDSVRSRGHLWRCARCFRCWSLAQRSHVCCAALTRRHPRATRVQRKARLTQWRHVQQHAPRRPEGWPPCTWASRRTRRGAPRCATWSGVVWRCAGAPPLPPAPPLRSNVTSAVRCPARSQIAQTQRLRQAVKREAAAANLPTGKMPRLRSPVRVREQKRLVRALRRAALASITSPVTPETQFARVSDARARALLRSPRLHFNRRKPLRTLRTRRRSCLAATRLRCLRRLRPPR
jgi:hypothetical protein